MKDSEHYDEKLEIITGDQTAAGESGSKSV